MFKWLSKLLDGPEENHEVHEEFREQLVDKDRWLTELLIDLDLNNINNLMEVAKINNEKNQQEAITAILKYCKPLILKMVENGELTAYSEPMSEKQMVKLFGPNYRQAFGTIIASHNINNVIVPLYSKGISISLSYYEIKTKGGFKYNERLFIKLLDNNPGQIIYFN